jgi:hypothetical protein
MLPSTEEKGKKTHVTKYEVGALTSVTNNLARLSFPQPKNSHLT